MFLMYSIIITIIIIYIVVTYQVIKFTLVSRNIINYVISFNSELRKSRYFTEFLNVTNTSGISMWFIQTITLVNIAFN